MLGEAGVSQERSSGDWGVMVSLEVLLDGVREDSLWGCAGNWGRTGEKVDKVKENWKKVDSKQAGGRGR